MAILILTRLDLADFKDSEDKNELSDIMLKNIIMPIKDRFAN
jgi:hypothetical protein